jgi:predicted transposase YbfD/YdcC
LLEAYLFRIKDGNLPIKKMEKQEVLEKFEKHFSGIQDTRKKQGKLHELRSILIISVLGVICGADEFVEIEEFGKSKIDFLSTFLNLKHGIPSHDTFGRVFSIICPDKFRKCFIAWVNDLRTISNDIVNIDGKALRHSFDTATEKSMIYMVSAWANKNNMVLGQIKVEDKSNEITAIPKLLKLLDLAGCVVTIDAMGTQTAIAEEIIEQGADYVLALKGNQSTLQEEVIESFEKLGAKSNSEVNTQVQDNHGRIEERNCYVVSAKDYLSPDVLKKWKSLTSIIKIEAYTTYKNGKNKGKQTYEERYYISSLVQDAQKINLTVQAHWGIETKLHWVLDVAFREDDSRVRKGHADENLSIVRHIAINKLKNEHSCKRGIKAKRKKAGWDNQYLLDILAA